MSGFYQYVCKRSSTFTLGIVIGAIFFERAYDHACEAIFERHNEGRLWMHIKDKYTSPPPEGVSPRGAGKGEKKKGK